ncbi:MAG TPA: hypothetical protein VF516_36930 [Kofleriaceae bacterium]
MTSLARIALALVVAPVLVFTAACDEEADKPETAQRAAMCRQLMAHIFQITPRPGSDRPETDPARIQELVARVPIEDIEQCAAVKDAVKPGEPPPPETQTPKVIACMQAATDARALRRCIPAQAE